MVKFISSDIVDARATQFHDRLKDWDSYEPCMGQTNFLGRLAVFGIAVSGFAGGVVADMAKSRLGFDRSTDEIE